MKGVTGSVLGETSERTGVPETVVKWGRTTVKWEVFLNHSEVCISQTKRPETVLSIFSVQRSWLRSFLGLKSKEDKPGCKEDRETPLPFMWYRAPQALWTVRTVEETSRHSRPTPPVWVPVGSFTTTPMALEWYLLHLRPGSYQWLQSGPSSTLQNLESSK